MICAERSLTWAGWTVIARCHADRFCRRTRIVYNGRTHLIEDETFADPVSFRYAIHAIRDWPVTPRRCEPFFVRLDGETIDQFDKRVRDARLHPG